MLRDPGARVAELACGFDVFWLPSEGLSEGIPTVLGEAMALGLPMVATDVGSVREAVDGGVNGYVVAPGDPEALAEATRPLLEDDDLRARLGAAGNRIAGERFAVARCVEAHLRAFEAALERRARSGRPSHLR